MRPNLGGQFPNPNKPKERQGKILFINADAEFHAGRAQNYLLPEHVEKIASAYERFEDIPDYAKCVKFDEIADPANDFDLNVRRYVDNSPPPEPHDVRAHLIGGVPAAEIDAKHDLFKSLGFDPSRAFVARKGDPKYRDFAPALADRAAIGPFIEADGGVAARRAELQRALAAWWQQHSPRLADLPRTRALNAARSELLQTFTTALQPLGILDHFKLAGVIATWWTDTLPDLKTLIENGFPGVIDGWVDAIADAVADDENVGPIFNPFGHKLVLKIMPDYLQRIEDAKAEVARLKGKKEAFEQSNSPDDADEEELKVWNYAKDLDRQIKEIKTDNADSLRQLKQLQKAAAKKSATADDRRKALEAEAEIQTALDQIAAIEESLKPYEETKVALTAARGKFRELTAQFVEELKRRCDAMSDPEKHTLVMELSAQDLYQRLAGAWGLLSLQLARFITGLWEKYTLPLTTLQRSRDRLGVELENIYQELGYQ
jgi:type I restriction enzyme M protein